MPDNLAFVDNVASQVANRPAGPQMPPQGQGQPPIPPEVQQFLAGLQQIFPQMQPQQADAVMNLLKTTVAAILQQMQGAGAQPPQQPPQM